MNYYLDNSAFLTELTDVNIPYESKTNYTPWIFCGTFVIACIVCTIVVINQHKKKIENESANKPSLS